LSLVSNADLVWKNGFRHGGQNKVAIEVPCIPQGRVSKFLEDEQRDMQTLVEWNKHKNLAPQEKVEKPIINNHIGHTWYMQSYQSFFLFHFPFNLTWSCLILLDRMDVF
jgi:hypothetical protein